MDMTNGYRTLEDVAREELGEYPEKKVKCVQEIREWILNDPKLNFCTDDDFIVKFLRCCKYDIDKTKKRMMNFYLCQKERPEWWSNRDCQSEEIKTLLNSRFQANLGQHPENGSCIIAFCSKDLDPRRLNGYMKLSTMAFETDMNSSVEVYGVSLIIDYTGVTMRFLTYFTYDFINSAVKYLQNALPVRIKAFHLLNFPRLWYPILQILKFFLSKKLNQRIYLHNDLKSLHLEIPISCLPSTYGGTKEDFEYFADQLCERIINNHEYFKRSEEFGLLE